jgi:hypothetical protein
MDEGRSSPLPVTDEGRDFPLPVTQNWTWDNQIRPARGRANAARATFVTIATADRAGQSRIFARSVRECHRDARLVVLALDPEETPRVFEDLYDLVIPAEQLSLGGLADMRFRYSIAELCFALKPWVIRHLFDRFAGDPIYYFDSDIELFTPLTEAESALAHGANLVLTPHILQPGLDQGRERALLRSGSFNAGFLAIAPSAQARAFVGWWCERVRTGCTHDPLEGTHGDQKWLELAPSICEGVTVLRHPGYNFAYWNAYERPLSRRGGAWTAGGWPLRFVHYSQWNLQEQDSEQYLARYFRHEYEPFAGLFAEYQKRVRAENPSCKEHLPGVNGKVFAPYGQPVPDLLRCAYARHGPAVDGNLSEVFAHTVSVLNARSKTRVDLPDLPITVLYDEIWQYHADLRYRFDVDQTSGRLAYLRWLVELGVAELGLPAAFAAPARSALERERVRQLEAGDETATPLPATVDPVSPALSASASTDTIAGLIAARDGERDRVRQRDNDIGLLVGSNKALRRELQALKVRRWRDEETIQALDEELARTRRTRDAATRRSRQFADQVASLGARWCSFSGWLGSGPQSSGGEFGRRPMLPGDRPFFKCGFRVSEAGAIAGAAARRVKGAPSGLLVYGPYLNLAPGSYAVNVDARLYQRLPVLANFKLDVVCDDARQIIGCRKFRLRSTARWQRFEMIFTVWDGENYPDFEMRIWAHKGTALEIGRVDLHQLTGEPPAASARGPDPNGCARLP